MVDKTSKEEQDKLAAAIKLLDETKKILKDNLDKILTKSQKVVEPHLKQVTDKGFVLVGGLSVSATTGHRQSDDFDYFGKFSFDPDKLRKELDFSALELDHTIEAKNTLEYMFNVPNADTGSKDLVKVSLFGKPDMTIQAITNIDGYSFSVAHPLDVFSAKLAALTTRESWKDYSDIAALIRISNYTLLQALDNVQHVFNVPTNEFTEYKDGILFLVDCVDKVKGVHPQDVTTIKLERKDPGWYQRNNRI
ncbi:hypothetical protein [Ewingella americana]|uniref:Uncharacterized protein n=1 Tax=Ewingella americana TaxID=41202 RepID=A0A502GCW3_9GAMM|nr:hypothetical protein [Ewingella americana]TPG59929.1 hypothetical protein EAH77_15290 [Ewingella americana]